MRIFKPGCPKPWVAGLVLGVCLWATPGASQAAGFNTLGNPGWLQTPSARLPGDGQLILNLARHQPYSTLSLGAQAFPWLYAAIRYTSIDDRPYGPGNDQSYKDKGFDLALRLWPEQGLRPAVVLGLVDIGGTGLFGSEYLVASRKFSDFDFSLGIGWGRLGSQADFANPLRQLSSGFAQRSDFDDVEGGSFTFDEWFSGQSVALFGAVVWRPRQGAWSFILERDGNRYDRDGLDPLRPDAEPAQGRVSAPSLWNLGVDYRPLPGVHLGISYLRGDTIAAQLSFAGQWGTHRPRPTAHMLPVWEALLPENFRRPPPPGDDQDAQAVAIEDELWHWRIFPHAIDLREKSASIWQTNEWTSEPLEAGLATARIALSRLPDEVTQLEVVELSAGLPILQTRWERARVDAAAREAVPQDALYAATPRADPDRDTQPQASHPGLLRFPTLGYGVNPALRSNLGGPVSFWLAEFQLKPYLTWQLSASQSITTTLAWSVYGNLDRANAQISSRLPNVRSRLERYQAEGASVYLDQLEWNSLHHLGRGWYGRVSAGIFEEMFGGIATEVLWKPAQSRLGLGLAVNRVRQRDFDQGFGFFNYLATTGHLSGYWNTPWWGVRVHASVGQYLAGDRGGTLRVSRRFANGFEVGAFATKTNVSSADFGEGSFDKGVFFRLPLQAIDPLASPGSVSFDYRFLTRDGGQKVDDGRALYPIVSSGSWHEN